MKKFLSLMVLSFLVNVSLVSADTVVNYPATFTLKVGEKVTVANLQNMQIEFVGRADAVTQSYPSTTRYAVEIKVSTSGGCGVGADPRCLGGPAYEEKYIISEGGYADALGLRIKATNVASSNVTFSVSLREDDTSKDDTTSTGGGGSVSPGPIIKGIEGTGGPGVIDGQDQITVCPMIATKPGEDNCMKCMEGECKSIKPPVSTKPGSPGATSGGPVINLPKGETFVSAKAEVSASGSAKAETAPAYEVKTVKKSRLFFIFPVSEEMTYSINAETGKSQVKSRPWWGFLAW